MPLWIQDSNASTAEIEAGVSAAEDYFGPGKASSYPNLALGKHGCMMGLAVGNDASITPGMEKQKDGISAALIGVAHRSYKTYPYDWNKK